MINVASLVAPSRIAGTLRFRVEYYACTVGLKSNPKKKGNFSMKKIYIALAFLAAFFATAGQIRHSENPLTSDGRTVSVGHKDLPFPICPPDCDLER